ncbi:MAG: phosphatidylserine decarboxylase [bacterium]|nr:phosphatidylserine decarboxylase [bacterium]
MSKPLKRPFIHPEGWIFVAIFATCAALLNMLSSLLGVLGWVLTAWCIYFFRNPIRVVPNREGLIVSPADGKICGIVEEVEPPAELGLDPKEKWTRVSIFLNVFDVHVNRVPIQGEITHSHYHPGKFFNASFDKASALNERQSLVVKVNNKISIPFVQIAGLIARRIRCDINVGDKVETGSLFGLIRFGSRMDVYLPKGVTPLVIKGQRAVGGETILADLTSKEKARDGTER